MPPTTIGCLDICEFDNDGNWGHETTLEQGETTVRLQATVPDGVESVYVALQDVDRLQHCLKNPREESVMELSSVSLYYPSKQGHTVPACPVCQHSFAEQSYEIRQSITYEGATERHQAVKILCIHESCVDTLLCDLGRVWDYSDAILPQHL